MQNQALNTAQNHNPFGMSMMSYSNEEFNYSFGMNTQEKDDEIYGKGNSYSAEYWQYDARLGRRWNMDPRPNPSISVYACFGNNPIWFSDVAGDTVRGVNNESGERMLNVLQETFSGNTEVQKLFKLSSDGQTLQSINKRDLKKAFKNLDNDQKTLLYGYYIAINSPDVHLVELINNNQKISKYGQKITGFENGRQFDSWMGGAANYETGNGKNFNSYSLIVMDSKTKVNFVSTNSNKKVSMLSEVGEVFAHEVLGHGLARALLSPNFKHEDAIQVSNIYLRSKNIGYYRDGSDHANHQILDKLISNMTPSFLIIPKNF